MTIDTENVPDPQRITDNLQSGEPARIAAGLAELDRAERRLQFVPVPPPDLDSLGAFGRGVPEETLLQFLNVWQNYPRFEPAPDPSEIRRTLVEAVLRHGGEQPIAQVGLNVRTDHFPPYAVRDTIKYLMDRDFSSPEEERRAQMLLTHLLDDATTHDATADGLASLALLDRHPGLVASLLPLLDENEKERIRAAQE
jgi:hypothetical protein